MNEPLFTGTPKVPVEFPWKALAGTVDLYECSICRALVTSEGSQPHAEWHSGERMRNFGGF